MKQVAIKIEERIQYVTDWLLYSGIQSESGGFYAWADAEDKTYSYLYPEITGYAITTMCFLHELKKEALYLSKAKIAAQWIIEKAMHPNGGVLTRDYVKYPVSHYSFESANIYAFDSAMVAFGLLKLYKAAKDKKYYQAAKNIVNFLIDNMLGENKLFYPIFDGKNDKVYEDDKKWSTQKGSFLCKVSLCLCELADIEQDEYYKKIAKDLISASIKTCYKDARFITNTFDESSHFHPLCYTLEGMAYYTHKTKDAKYNSCFEEAFNWVLGLQEHDGGIPTSVIKGSENRISHQRADIQAQALRLYYLNNKDCVSGFDKDKLLARLLEFQNIGPGQNGAFFFGFDSDGSYKKHANTWCSMFALQALYLATGKTDKNIVLEYLV
ncbi:MAG: hypothetical protein V2A72_05940 [Candidatus Omnitrophota bacterium]